MLKKYRIVNKFMRGETALTLPWDTIDKILELEPDAEVYFDIDRENVGIVRLPKN